MLQPKDKPCFAPELRMQLGRPDQLTVITRVTPRGGKAWSYFPEVMMLRNACWAPYSGSKRGLPVGGSRRSFGTPSVPSPPPLET